MRTSSGTKPGPSTATTKRRAIVVALSLGWCVLSIAGARTAEPDDSQRARDATTVELLMRLEGIDLDTMPEYKAAVLRHLATVKGQPEYLDIIERFNIRDRNEELLKLAIADPAGTVGVAAVDLLFKFGDADRLQAAVDQKDEEVATKTVTALGYAGGRRALQMLVPMVTDTKRSIPLRTAAVTGLGRTTAGQRTLLVIVRTGKLPADLNFPAANILLTSRIGVIRNAAAEHLKLPASKAGKPLPPTAELVRRTGDPARGKVVFEDAGTCANCHIVQGKGKEVGPDLSEIGTKLARQAMFESILNPNAGILQSYESYVVVLENGQIFTGLITSRTADSIVLKTEDAIVRTIKTADLEEEPAKSPISLMASDLQKNMTAEQLVDLVEYLMTLKRPEQPEK